MLLVLLVSGFSVLADTTMPEQQSGMYQAVEQQEVGSGITTVNPFMVVFGLLLIIVLIFVVAWLLRKLSVVSMAGNQTMKVLGALPVGTRERVLLVDVAGEQLLLGVAPGRVSYLKSLDSPVVTDAANTSGEFSSKLKQLLQTADNK